MAAIHKLQCIGATDSGESGGVALPRDDLRLEGLINDDGELVERPEFAVTRVDDGEWRIRRLDGGAFESAGD